MNQFYWLMRRELWEHRSIYIVPMVVVGLLVATYAGGWLLSDMSNFQADFAMDGSHDAHTASMSGTQLRDYFLESAEGQKRLKVVAGVLPFIVPTALVNIVMLLIWFFYLASSLYNDRRDRSVLFWKSLPVSDTATVLSKLATAMLVIPAVALATIIGGAFLLSLINTVVIAVAGANPFEFVWAQLPIFSAPLTLAYAFAVQSMWYAPVFGWLLLASAWARRAPALWAILPPALAMMIEGVVWHSSHFAMFLAQRLQPVVPTAYRDGDIDPVLHDLSESPGPLDWSQVVGQLIDPQTFLSDPGLWGGLVAAAIFVAAAVWLRRYREAT